MSDASQDGISRPESPDWLSAVGQHSQFAIALLEPDSLTVREANAAFRQLLGDRPLEGAPLSELFADLDATAQTQLYHRHLLRAILRDCYQIEGGEWNFLEEPIVVTVRGTEQRYLEFWLCSANLRAERIDREQDEFADINLRDWLESETISPQQWEEKINWSNYRASGQLLWEGVEVTAREQVRRLTAWAIAQNTFLEPTTFARLGEQLRSLFRASGHLAISLSTDFARTLFDWQGELEEDENLPLEVFKDSHFLRAAEAQRIWNVPDLDRDCPTELEELLQEAGVRSLLIVPLRREDVENAETLSSFLYGFVVIASDRANHFTRLDADRAETLIPAFKTAFRQVAPRNLTRIHPAVEWRFLQEAERRSLGLPSQPIAFSNVYPLYGISDVRGSSSARNFAIQTDLVAQFNLALEIVEAARQEQPIEFLEQLAIDLQLYAERISREIKVEDEIGAIDYLANHLEIYFDYFRQCGASVIATIEAYELACTNDRGFVSGARDRYDRSLNTLNDGLLSTWERHQVQMQQILPHYCDLEVSDGIDCVLYCGAAINDRFSLFHLHSLRYAHLRAICDCARTGLKIRDRLELPFDVSHLVLIQNSTIDIFHDEKTDKVFDVRGSRDTRYEIAKKRIDKAKDAKDSTRITQPGTLTLVYSTPEEWSEYHQYLRYLVREGWVGSKIDSGSVEPLQGLTGLKYARVAVISQEERES